jgi:acyl-CoA synthetase (AMP-forming)/AMP-acid ligase II
MSNVVDLRMDEEGPPTLGPIHLAVERKHERSAVVRRRDRGDPDRWLDTPDWRFHRHVIRIALYLRQRAGLKTGDRVAVVAPPGLEWLITTWAVMLEGGVVVALDPQGGADQWLDAWAQNTPRAALVADGAAAAALSLTAKDARFLVLDGACPSEACVSFSEALDLGGTLDTAERANEFRARLRELSPEAPAVAHDDGDGRWSCLTQREVVHRLRAQWLVLPPRAGDIGYVTTTTPTLAMQLAAHGLVADGRSVIAFGSRAKQAEEIARLRPRTLVTKAGIVEVPAVEAPPRPTSRASRWREWISRVPERLRVKEDATSPRDAESSRPGGSS